MDWGMSDDETCSATCPDLAVAAVTYAIDGYNHQFPDIEVSLSENGGDPEQVELENRDV
jgi:hypothetical protein